ncbi:hypothetical protein GCM10029964_088440 [Kibdelosporangium lantanae]
MPGWYVHLEAAKQTAQRLRDGDIPSGFPLDPTQAQALGEVCHTWRNYLALGSLGPDLFYLLPDFANTRGCVLRQVIQWVIDVWSVIDAQFVGKWEKWIDPIQTNDAQLAGQLKGGLSNQLGAILDELSAAIMSAFEGLLAQMGDWFGVLTSGVPQGYGNDAFYWSDMFHYRRTYQFPYTLFQQALQAREAATTDTERLDADARMAFAVGWMSHCATDVTGHPFTNAKAGGRIAIIGSGTIWSRTTWTAKTIRPATPDHATANAAPALCTSMSRSGHGTTNHTTCVRTHPHTTISPGSRHTTRPTAQPRGRATCPVRPGLGGTTRSSR